MSSSTVSSDQRAPANDPGWKREISSWLISLIFHLLILVVVTLIAIPVQVDSTILTMLVPLDEEPELLEEAQHFKYEQKLPDEIGAGNLRGDEEARSESPEIADESLVPQPDLFVESEVSVVSLTNEVEFAAGKHLNEDLNMPGASGVGTTGTMGAIDHITHEILLALQERKVLVVWMFDRSWSLQQQRDEITARFDRVYEELGVIATSKNRAIRQYRNKPLLTSVISFGEQVELLTEEPTDDLELLKTKIADIQGDDSGIERVFSAVHMAANEYKIYRRRDSSTGEPMRNILFVVFTDEVGDDSHLLEPSITLCRRYAIPVYVVGVPAPFGRKHTLLKWVDPDPQYDQTPQLGRVTQGPESLFAERIKLHFSGSNEETTPIDSGFGPFTLTRLCHETGGIYFAVHPNRTSQRSVTLDETSVSSAHLKYFFDPVVMRKYRPDYVSYDEYQQRVASSASRTALIKSAQMSWIEPLERPRLSFPKRSEADLANQLKESQKRAAKLEPKVNMLYQTLKLGEKSREQEESLRWCAGYDLAIGRLLAVKVRTETYNAMLAQAKQSMKFKDPKSDTWILQASQEISVGSQLKKQADSARMYLNRVIQEHPGTPWELLARRELREPMGWKWSERYTGVNQPRPSDNGNGVPRPPRDDQRRMLPPPKPRRSPPPL